MIQGSHLVSLVRAEAGTEVMWSAILESNADRRIRVLNHIDFTGDELDPLVIKWLEEQPSPEPEHELSMHFAYPHQVVTGSYATYLQGRLDTLRRWNAEHPSEAVRRWTGAMISDFERWIRREAHNEAEERP